MENRTGTQYRKCFIDYLKHTKAFRRQPEELVQTSLLKIEGDIESALCQCGLSDTTIYAVNDKFKLNQIKNETNSGGKLYHLNSHANGRIRESIDFYIGFLESKYHSHAECELKTIHSEHRPSEKETPLKKGCSSPTGNTTKPKITLKEGGKLQVRDSEAYARNPKAREECIKAYNSEYKCVVCGMNFVETYGEIGKEFIEVHHLFPISQTNGVHEIDPAKDLIPLCSNCHSMIHRLEDPSDWQSLKQFFESSRNA